MVWKTRPKLSSVTRLNLPVIIMCIVYAAWSVCILWLSLWGHDLTLTGPSAPQSCSRFLSAMFFNCRMKNCSSLSQGCVIHVTPVTCFRSYLRRMYATARCLRVSLKPLQLRPEALRFQAVHPEGPFHVPVSSVRYKCSLGSEDEVIGFWRSKVNVVATSWCHLDLVRGGI